METIKVTGETEPFSAAKLTSAVADDVKVAKTVTVADEPKEEAKGELDRRDFCPNCSIDLRGFKEREVSDEEKTLWLRHVLGEERFTKAYSMYGGRVNIVLRSRTLEESNAVFEQLKVEPSGEGMTGLEPEFLSKVNSYALVSSLASYNDEVYPPVTRENYPDTEHLLEEEEHRSAVALAYEKHIQKLPEGVVSAMIQCLNDFDHLVQVLQQHCNDSDFWSTTVVGT